jgi:hypothetical protein
MGEARTSPWVRNLILLVGFLVLVAIGVFTVVLPELEEPEEPEPPATTAEPDAQS